MTYQTPIAEFMHILKVLDYKNDAYDSESVCEILKNVGSFVREEMIPSNKEGDQLGVGYNSDDKSVSLPDSFKKVYQDMCAGGYVNIGLSENIGGGGAPHIVSHMVMEMLIAGNLSLSLCPLLTDGAIVAIDKFASQDLKDAYLANLVSGKFSATMCLTEPQCGTDLGLIQSKAQPSGDAYKITGNKIWITFGEHELTDNIVHLVLAKLPDAPQGIKGISMFLVPKYRLNGSRNNVFCTGLEHKMGSHASPTCVMNFEDADGWLVGEPHKGMRAMFAMMNPARISVGVQGLALSEIAYQTALTFAKDRRQSRSLDPNKIDNTAAADVILVHPDVRRMLLKVKSTNIAMRALVAYCSLALDRGDDDLVGLLTPVVKSYCSSQGFLNVSECLQVLGGAGYTRDWHIEQYLRDARISMIYEGTNGIQALDLVGRKLPKDGGKAMIDLLQQMQNEMKDAREEFKEATEYAINELMSCNQWLLENAMQDKETAAAAASEYLEVFALTLMSYMWMKLTKTSQSEYIKTGLFFIDYILPQIEAHSKRVKLGKKNLFYFKEDEF